ncbi:NERD domain-containing protein [Hafnia alvei]|uniref:NERD domain-containing protein n=1 Tax=Hafnia alvei TaxID=569 RepID=UPI000E06DAD4|nr:NERD domain-containing protein [Hafnia alvei]STQ68696.1 Nuclease-related domain [Hafnia alvei]
MTVSTVLPTNSHIYIGEPIANQSEYDCFLAVYETLSARDDWFYIFANFHVEGRQIDLAIFTPYTTLVIEAKGYSLPVSGEINGQWMQHGPYGTKKIRNAYNQALDGKNALRDAMQRVASIHTYPNSSVIISPDIPDGSRLTHGDFKVQIGGLELITSVLRQPSGAILTDSQCEILSKQLGLEFVSTKDAAINNELLEATRACNTYVDSFLEFYKPIAAKMVDDRYGYSGNEISRQEVSHIIAENECGVVIQGPSGCGKTLLTISCATYCIGMGCLPIIISAKYFNGYFKDLLDKEISLLHTHSAIRIINAARIVGIRIILFLDGYNECSEELRVRLTRSLKIFSLRYDAKIVINTQYEPERADLLHLKTVTINRPSEDLKIAISEAENIHSVTQNTIRLLKATNSGLEASLIGNVGNLVSEGASRFVVISTYARERLKAATAEGIYILSVFADTLIKRIRFSLSVREFDRLCDSHGLSLEAKKELYGSQLLQKHGDKVSFAHELFFSAFVAEAVMRMANGDAEYIRKTLVSPKYALSKTFILGAIEDDLLLNEVLEGLEDQYLITACAHGECGIVAQSIINKRIQNLISAMVVEAKGFNFLIHGKGWHGIKIDQSCLNITLKYFDLYIDAIGNGLMSGQFFHEVMSACQLMDESIAIFSEKSMLEAEEKNIPLCHSVFSAAYVMHRKAALSKLISSVVDGGLSFYRQVEIRFDKMLYQAWSEAHSFSQYYFLLGMSRFNADSNILAPKIITLIRGLASFPYHLQLQILYFLKYCRDIDESYRVQIIDALHNALDKHGIMMNSIIIEAIRDIGGLTQEEDDYLPVIKQEIEQVLSFEGIEADQMAWSVYSKQFDHPFESSYWEEIQGLDDGKRKLLLTKACRGANSSYPFFLGILISRLADFNDPGIATAIIPWASLPEKIGVFPQEGVEIFIHAHEALGHLGIPVPEWRGKPITSADHALLACGELYYWLNRSDVKDPQESLHTLAARQVLVKYSRCASAGILQLTTSQMLSLDGTRKSLINHYPHIALEIAKDMANAKQEQMFYFQHGFMDNTESVMAFSFQIIGKLGDETDLLLLKGFCNDEKLALAALDAIKNIELRLAV